MSVDWRGTGKRGRSQATINFEQSTAASASAEGGDFWWVRRIFAVVCCYALFTNFSLHFRPAQKIQTLRLIIRHRTDDEVSTGYNHPEVLRLNSTFLCAIISIFASSNLSVSRLGRAGSNSPDAMSSSYHGNSSSSLNNEPHSLVQMSTSLIENVHPDRSCIMVQSLDSSMLGSSSGRSSSEASSVRSVIPPLNGSYKESPNRPLSVKCIALLPKIVFPFKQTKYGKIVHWWLHQRWCPFQNH